MFPLCISNVSKARASGPVGLISQYVGIALTFDASDCMTIILEPDSEPYSNLRSI